MRKRMKRLTALAAGCAILFSAAGASDYEAWLADGTVPSLKERYAGIMDIGIPAEAVLDADPAAAERIVNQCSLLVCEEAVRGKKLLDRSASKRKKDPEHARLNPGNAAEALNFARDRGMKVRCATVVQPENSPGWFFNENWAESGSARQTDRETMIRRMENALRDQIAWTNEKYPGLVTSWEVVRGGQDPEQDPYRETIGEDYPALAFAAARRSAAENQTLVWSLTEIPDGETLGQLRELHRQGLLDGVSLECSLTMEEEELSALPEIMREITETGLEIHLSGLEILNTDRTAAGQMRLASRYRGIFAAAEEIRAGSVSLPALQDAADRGKDIPPRLFNEKGRPAPAFFGALQDDAVPMPGNEDAVRAAAERLDLETLIRKEAAPVVVYKKTENHNPVMTQRFGADPWAMVYGNRVYLFMTGDEPVIPDGEAKPKTNDYGNITTLRVLSSEDLVNWTDHGSVRAAGGSGAAKWASNSWAPCAAWKNIGGQDRFFLYFANSGGGIGVLVSDHPTGSFTDPIGKPLVSRSTPGCADVTWLFDPAVLTEEDGSAWLYFGGGIPEGKQADPGTARVVKLGADMVSLDGEPMEIRPPWLFEDSGINRFGDTYVYSYCTNFSVPAGGSSQGFGSGEIVYMTADRPEGPFAYAGQVLKNPGAFLGVGGNNHHCMFRFGDQWYITYHAATLDKAMGWNAGYRSVFVDRLELTAEGLPAPTRGSLAGVPQVRPFDPFRPVSGATAVSMAGVTTELVRTEDRKAGTGPMAAVSMSPDGWIAVAGVDFGETGAGSVRMSVRSEVPAKIEIMTDREDSEPAAVLEIPACDEDTEITAELPAPLSGTHDLYFRFTESGTALLEWQFR